MEVKKINDQVVIVFPPNQSEEYVTRKELEEILLKIHGQNKTKKIQSSSIKTLSQHISEKQNSNKKGIWDFVGYAIIALQIGAIIYLLAS